MLEENNWIDENFIMKLKIIMGDPKDNEYNLNLNFT